MTESDTVAPKSIGSAKKDVKLTNSRIRLLYFLWDKRGWKDSINQLAKARGEDAGNTNKAVNDLINGGYLEEQDLKITKKGRKRIRFLMLPKYYA